MAKAMTQLPTTREEWIDLMTDRMRIAMREIFMNRQGHGLGFRIDWTKDEPQVDVMFYTPTEDKKDEAGS